MLNPIAFHPPSGYINNGPPERIAKDKKRDRITMNTLFDYLNYREFLRDYYSAKKKEHSFYSYRLFSQKAGFASPNFLKLVIDGKRNLSKESVFKFIQALKLTKPEADYFENLVFFNQCGSLDEKNHYLSRLMKYRTKSDPAKIEESEYDYYSAWYHPVIRELATAMDFEGDYRRLGQMAVPAISALQAEKSVKLLLKLGFIRTGATGRFEKTSMSLTTGPQVRSIAVANYHKVMMKLGSESLERFGSQDRDITSLTLSVSEKTRNALIARIAAFRKELLDLASADTGTQRIVQLNLQLFPLSEKFEERGKS